MYLQQLSKKEWTTPVKLIMGRVEESETTDPTRASMGRSGRDRHQLAGERAVAFWYMYWERDRGDYRIHEQLCKLKHSSVLIPSKYSSQSRFVLVLLLIS